MCWLFFFLFFLLPRLLLLLSFVCHPVDPEVVLRHASAKWPRFRHLKHWTDRLTLHVSHHNDLPFKARFLPLFFPAEWIWCTLLGLVSVDWISTTCFDANSIAKAIFSAFLRVKWFFHYLYHRLNDLEAFLAEFRRNYNVRRAYAMKPRTSQLLRLLCDYGCEI